MKAYKSLDAYNFFVSGWVNGVLAKELEEDKVLLFVSGELGKIAITFKLISSIRYSYKATYCIYSLSCISN